MKSTIAALLGLFLLVGLAAQTSQTGAKQPDAKTKPAEKAPVGAKTGDPKAAESKTSPANPAASAPFAMPKPAPEIERITNMLQGRWETEEKHEPSEIVPQGGTGKGVEAIRPGPGGLSLISEYQSEGPGGIFAGFGLMTWDSAAKVYHIHWTDNTAPGVSVMTGKWEGKDLVFTGSETMMGKKLFSRHAFTELAPTTFIYTIDMGPALTQLKRAVTIKYSKVNMEEMRGRRPRRD
ncbi:MAG TPA: DUF1579 family protein [Terriglobales bacterium]|nr:DUF1579 family protein [Terriglobales bacterium]